MGNIPDWNRIKKIARTKSIYLIEDSADTLGYKIRGKNTGSLSHIVTTSFCITYNNMWWNWSMVCTNSKSIYENESY